MKKGNDVFLLTLVDLLLQLLFLGLLVSAVAAAERDKEPIRPETLKPTTVARLDSISAAQGFANVDALTDELTRLAPVRELRQLAGIAGLVGGADSVATLVEKARRGSGAPPCIYKSVGKKEEPVPVANVTAWDDSVRVESIGDSLTRLLKDRGGLPAPVNALKLGEFRTHFESLVRGECRYHVILVERTEYKRARDTVTSIFSRAR